MTETEWLASTDPVAMLRMYTSDDMPWTAGVPAPIISNRKLRLFACACCRRVWHLLTDERSRHAVEVAERYADGLATRKDLCRAAAASYRVMDKPPPSIGHPAIWDAHMTCVTAAIAAVRAVLSPTVALSPADQAALLRDIVGNPFRLVRVDPTWLTYNDGFVVRLARSMYDESAFDCLPILADALIDAGCPEKEEECSTCGGNGWIGKISLTGGKDLSRPCPAGCRTGVACNPLLAHLRSPGPHVRGCWVLDLLLGLS